MAVTFSADCPALPVTLIQHHRRMGWEGKLSEILVSRPLSSFTLIGA
jgi:hypothetical protein